MTAENFCYWLRGFIEISKAGDGEITNVTPAFTAAQVDMIDKHLDYVFNPMKYKQTPPVATSSTPTSGLASGLGGLAGLSAEFLKQQDIAGQVLC